MGPDGAGWGRGVVGLGYIRCFGSVRCGLLSASVRDGELAIGWAGARSRETTAFRRWRILVGLLGGGGGGDVIGGRLGGRRVRFVSTTGYVCMGWRPFLWGWGSLLGIYLSIRTSPFNFPFRKYQREKEKREGEARSKCVSPLPGYTHTCIELKISNNLTRHTDILLHTNRIQHHATPLIIPPPTIKPPKCRRTRNRRRRPIPKHEIIPASFPRRCSYVRVSAFDLVCVAFPSPRVRGRVAGVRGREAGGEVEGEGP